MAQVVLIFLLLAATIVVAGCFLTRYADALADRTGLGKTLVGTLFLASATSLPELATDCSAAVKQLPDIVVGTVIGSSLWNLMILAVLDFCHSRPERIFSSASVHHALAAVTSVVLTAVAVLAILLRNFQLQLWGMGLESAVILIVYVIASRLILLDQRHHMAHQQVQPLPVSTRLSRIVCGFSLASVVILIAAWYLAPVADQLADQSGLGGTFVGSTMVALTTSLPEVVTTAAAVRMGAFDLAVGNVFGSNTFNMIILAPADLCYRQGALLQNCESQHAVTGAAVIIVTGFATLGLLYRPKKRLPLVEPDALAILLFSTAAIVALYFMRGQ